MNSSLEMKDIHWQRIADVFNCARNVRNIYCAGIGQDAFISDYYCTLFINKLAESGIFGATDDETIRDCVNEAINQVIDQGPITEAAGVGSIGVENAHWERHITVAVLQVAVLAFLATARKESGELPPNTPRVILPEKPLGHE